MEIENGSVNPFKDEAVYTQEQLKEELLKELENLERKKAYILELLEGLDA